MSYPAASQIDQAAAQFGVDSALMYAFAAYHQRIPTNSTDVQSFASALNFYVTGVGATLSGGNIDVATRYVEGFTEANGIWPVNTQVLQSWLTSVGAWDRASNAPTGSVPYAGQFYPPGGASMTSTAPPPNNIVPGPTQAQANLSGVGAAANGAVQTATDWVRQNEKTIVVGVVAVGGYYLGIWQGLLKSFRRRY